MKYMFDQFFHRKKLMIFLQDSSHSVSALNLSQRVCKSRKLSSVPFQLYIIISYRFPNTFISINQLIHIMTSGFKNELFGHIQRIGLLMTNTLAYIEQEFNQLTENINFPIFCVLYSIVFLYVVSRLMEQKYYHPKPIQDLTFKEKIKSKLAQFMMSVPIIRSILKKKLNEKLKEVKLIVHQEFQKQRDSRKAYALPQQGMKPQKIKKRMEQWVNKQIQSYQKKTISGAIYTYQIQHQEQVSDFAAKYMYHNPLHMDTFPQLLRMQSQLLKMTGNLVTQKEAHGIITTGGSQSLIMMLYAYRKFFPDRKKPNVVYPISGHAALDKGCFYLNIQARKARLNDKFQVDVDHMQSLIDENTIMILGSAPSYPHGIIDPIDKIAKLAIKYKVGMHVDACLGGFILGFSKQNKNIISLDRDGVTSVSLDHHKYGLSPKGIASIFYKTNELRHCHYYYNTEWIGGLYATISYAGSRSGFSSAGAWYSLTRLTRNTFIQNAQKIEEATKKIASDLSKIPGVIVYGNPVVVVVSFTTTTFPIYKLGDILKSKYNYQPSVIQRPSGIHYSITNANVDRLVADFAKDVSEILQKYKDISQVKESSTTIFYGMTKEIPTAGILNESIKAAILGQMM